MVKTLNDCHIWASGQFLGEFFPEDWEDWEDEVLAKFIDCNLCEFNEFADPDFVLEQIMDLGASAYKFFVKDTQ